MKTLTQQCLVYVGELAHKFAEQDFADLPLTILSQILPYLSAAQLHRLDDVFKQTGISTLATWRRHLHQRWPHTHHRYPAVFGEAAPPEPHRHYMEKHFHELLRHAHFGQHTDPSCVLDMCLHHMISMRFPIREPSSSVVDLPLHAQLISFAPHVQRLSITALQCCHLVQSSDLMALLQQSVETLDLHLGQDRYYHNMRAFLLSLLVDGRLQHIALYNTRLMQRHIKDLLRVCAGHFGYQGVHPRVFVHHHPPHLNSQNASPYLRSPSADFRLQPSMSGSGGNSSLISPPRLTSLHLNSNSSGAATSSGSATWAGVNEDDDDFLGPVSGPEEEEGDAEIELDLYDAALLMPSTSRRHSFLHRSASRHSFRFRLNRAADSGHDRAANFYAHPQSESSTKRSLSPSLDDPKDGSGEGQPLKKVSRTESSGKATNTLTSQTGPCCSDSNNIDVPKEQLPSNSKNVSNISSKPEAGHLNPSTEGEADGPAPTCTCGQGADPKDPASQSAKDSSTPGTSLGKTCDCKGSSQKTQVLHEHSENGSNPSPTETATNTNTTTDQNLNLCPLGSNSKSPIPENTTSDKDDTVVGDTQATSSGQTGSQALCCGDAFGREVSPTKLADDDQRLGVRSMAVIECVECLGGNLGHYLAAVLPTWTGLENLTLTSTRTKSTQLSEVLLSRLELGQLRSLVLEDTPLCDNVLCFLTQALTTPRTLPLKVMKLSNNLQELCVREGDAVAVEGPFVGTETLDLSYNTFVSSGIAHLGQLLHHDSALRHLVLEACHFSEPEVITLLRSIQSNGRLETLSLAENLLTINSQTEVTRTITALPRLKSLNLNTCLIDAQIAVSDEFVSAVLEHPRLERLTLATNRLGGAGCHLLQRVLEGCHGNASSGKPASPLRWLDLGYNCIPGGALISTAQAVQAQILQAAPSPSRRAPLRRPFLNGLVLSGNLVSPHQRSLILRAFTPFAAQVVADTLDFSVPLAEHISQM